MPSLSISGVECSTGAASYFGQDLPQSVLILHSIYCLFILTFKGSCFAAFEPPQIFLLFLEYESSRRGQMFESSIDGVKMDKPSAHFKVQSCMQVQFKTSDFLP